MEVIPPVEDFFHSEWFAIVAGISSVLGFIVTLYQLRVKHNFLPRFRRAEWYKSILISLGIGIIVTGYIKFYNQPRPSFDILGDVHDFLHNNDHAWTSKLYEYSSAKFDISNH